MEKKNTSTAVVRVIVAGDLPLLRYGLIQLLAANPAWQVCGEAAEREELLRKMETVRPDLLIVGLPLDGGGYVKLVRHLKNAYPHVKILAATLQKDPVFAYNLLRAGARGYIQWNEPLANIVQAVCAVIAGELHVDTPVVKRLLRQIAADDPTEGQPGQILSEQELNVLTLIGQGLTTQQIADKLDLSPRTIESHRKKIKLKLGLTNAAQLNHHAYQWVNREAD